jgi:hypothetical protein
MPALRRSIPHGFSYRHIAVHFEIHRRPVAWLAGGDQFLPLNTALIAPAGCSFAAIGQNHPYDLCMRLARRAQQTTKTAQNICYPCVNCLLCMYFVVNLQYFTFACL